MNLFFPDKNLPFSEEANEVYDAAYNLAYDSNHEFITPEHFLLCMSKVSSFCDAIKKTGGNIKVLNQNLENYLNKLDTLPQSKSSSPSPSYQLKHMTDLSERNALQASRNSINIAHIIKSILSLDESFACNLLLQTINNEEGQFISYLITEEEVWEDLNPENNPFLFVEGGKEQMDWKSMVVCLNDSIDSKNPLIGREKELEATIRILCRK